MVDTGLGSMRPGHATRTYRPKRRQGHDPDTTFDFLGCTHVRGRSRRGKTVVRRITAKRMLCPQRQRWHDEEAERDSVIPSTDEHWRRAADQPPPIWLAASRFTPPGANPGPVASLDQIAPNATSPASLGATTEPWRRPRRGTECFDRAPSGSVRGGARQRPRLLGPVESGRRVGHTSDHMRRRHSQ